MQPPAVVQIHAVVAGTIPMWSAVVPGTAKPARDITPVTPAKILKPELALQTTGAKNLIVAVGFQKTNFKL